MGKLHISVNYLLGLLCASAFAVQALAVESTARVSTTIDANGYRSINSSTVRVPSGVTVRPLPSVQIPDVSKMSNGGLQQIMHGSVSVNDTAGSQPINMRVRATVPTLKGGAKSLLKGGLAGIALTAGIEMLLDSLDWIIEGGQIKKLTNEPGVYITEYNGDYVVSIPSIPTQLGYNHSPCIPYYGYLAYCYIPENPNWETSWTECRYSHDGLPLVGTNRYTCFYGNSAPPLDPNNNHSGFFGTPLPVPPQDIDAAVDSYYVPEPPDWPLLSPRIVPDDVEVYQLPSTIYGEPETIIEYDPQGNPQTTIVKQPAYDLVPRDNPSPQPALDLETKLETRTYNEYGDLTGITEATSTSPAGDVPEVPLDIPTDCDFMPTVCEFIDWFKTPDPELSQDADFSQLIDDVDIERDFSVGSSTASCPAPFVIPLKWVPSVEVSLQPFCDFADLLRPVLLALAYLVSGAIILRT